MPAERLNSAHHFDDAKMIQLIEHLGAAIIDGVARLGTFVLFLGAAVFYVSVPPYKPRLLIRQIRAIGADSFFLVGLIGLFTGMVLGLQGYNTLRRFGSEGALGSVVSLVLVRELGPVLAALMIAARAGSAMAAEIGAMQATEQVDALTVMAINPMQYLVSPRVLAGVLSFPLLTVIFDVIGIWGGWLIGVVLMGAPSGPFFNGIKHNMTGHDILTGLVKGLVFGLVVMWVSCYKGYYAARMATGVSRATTEAVVLSSVLVLASDYFLTAVLL
jgi:phospholipid/cholesterol/gamma-HCH transport system permease protein